MNTNLWVKEYYCSYTIMDLALNDPLKLICYSTKKPNLSDNYKAWTNNYTEFVQKTMGEIQNVWLQSTDNYFILKQRGIIFLISWILTAGQREKLNFILSGYRIVFIVYSYSHFLSSFLRVFFHTVIPNQYKCNIMAEGFRFMPLGLVRQWTFRLSAWVT